MFDNLYSRKQINKKALTELNLTDALMCKYSNKITKETYKEIDIKNLILELFDNIKYKKRNPIQMLISENEYYGYIQSTINIPDNYVLVVDINTKHTPKIKTYVRRK